MKSKLFLITEKEAGTLINENNHLSNNEELIYELFNVDKLVSKDVKGVGLEHRITNWSSDESFISLSGEPYIFVMYKNHWLPYIEYMLIKELIDKYTNKRTVDINIFNLKFGYIDGRQHHLAIPKDINLANKFPGYIMYISIGITENN